MGEDVFRVQADRRQEVVSQNFFTLHRKKCTSMCIQIFFFFVQKKKHLAEFRSRSLISYLISFSGLCSRERYNIRIHMIFAAFLSFLRNSFISTTVLKC